MKILQVAICLVVCGGAAYAAPVQYRISGTVDVKFQVGPLPPGVAQGASFTAILSYDSATPDSRPDDPQRGIYTTAINSENFLIVRVGPSDFRSLGALSFDVGNDREIDDPMAIDGFPDDSFSLPGVPFEGNFEHASTTFLTLRLYDPTGNAFDSDALPMTLDGSDFVDPFTLTAPFIAVSTFEIDNRIHQFRFNAVIDSIEVIPEPTTRSLAGFVAIIYCGYRRRR